MVRLLGFYFFFVFLFGWPVVGASYDMSRDFNDHPCFLSKLYY